MVAPGSAAGRGLLSQAALPQWCPHLRLPGTQATFIPDMKEARGAGGTSFKLWQVLAWGWLLRADE